MDPRHDGMNTRGVIFRNSLSRGMIYLELLILHLVYIHNEASSSVLQRTRSEIHIPSARALPKARLYMDKSHPPTHLSLLLRLSFGPSSFVRSSIDLPAHHQRSKDVKVVLDQC